MGWASSTDGEERDEYKVLLGTLRERLGRQRPRWKDNIKVDL
jgi:hypothetical protein